MMRSIGLTVFGVAFGWSVLAWEPAKKLVLPDNDPQLWICVNTDVGRTCLLVGAVKAWILKNGGPEPER